MMNKNQEQDKEQPKSQPQPQPQEGSKPNEGAITRTPEQIEQRKKELAKEIERLRNEMYSTCQTI